MTDSTTLWLPESPGRLKGADVLGLLRARPRAVLELGCGASKADPSSVGIDLVPGPGVDVVGDALDALRSLPDGCVDRIYSSHFLEHIDDVTSVLRESQRVLKEGAVFEAIVPHHANPWFYSDPTHRTFFGLYTMSYYADDALFRRRVPTYMRIPGLRLDQVDLLFKSSRPFYGRHLLKRVWQALFNSTGYLKELYEEMFTGWVPCYEIRYIMTKRSPGEDGRG